MMFVLLKATAVSGFLKVNCLVFYTLQMKATDENKFVSL